MVGVAITEPGQALANFSVGQVQHEWMTPKLQKRRNKCCLGNDRLRMNIATLIKELLKGVYYNSLDFFINIKILLFSFLEIFPGYSIA